MNPDRLTPSDLSANQWRWFRTTIANGCGGKGGWIRPPQFMFRADCDKHDFGYWVGGDDEDRLDTDARFFGAMVTDAARLKVWRRPFHLMMAYIYFRAVRFFGRRFFRYGTPRTLDDLPYPQERAR